MESRNVRQDDVKDVCRTCMTVSRNKRAQKLVPIFTKLDDAFIANIITDCTGVQISENDALPAAICSDCFETVKLLAAFMKATRDSDSKLRRLCKVESTQDEMDMETDTAHFLEVKCEDQLEQMEDETVEDPAYASDDAEPDNDTDSDWKGSDEEVERSAKRTKLGLKSKPQPRMRTSRSSPKKQGRRKSQKLVQPEQNLELNEEERKLFAVIEVPPGSHACCGCLQIFQSAEELETHRQATHVWKNQKILKPRSTKPTCEGCLRSYDTPRSVKRHQERVQQLKVIWECNKCKIRFNLAGKRRNHVELHAEGMPVAMVARFKESTQQEFGWLCCATKCGQSYTTEKDLIAHALESHWGDKLKADQESADKPEQCQICFRRFSDMQKVVSHQRQLYYKRGSQCSLCGLQFTHSFQLRAHEVKEHGSTAYQCKICNKTFTTSPGLNRHLNTIHNTDANRIRIRKLWPKQLAQKEQNMKLNEEEQGLFTIIDIPPNSHTCCGCLQIYESAEELDVHRQTNHVWKKEKLMKPMPEKLLCDGCLRRYDTPRGVKSHQERVQLLKTIWECNKCKIRFKVPGKRREHAKLHADGTPVAMVARFKETTQQEFGWMCCATNCGQSYETEQELIEHSHLTHWGDKLKEDVESADKPDQCQICFRRFADRSKVVAHQRKLYYQRDNHQCALCGLKFKNKTKLTSHEVKEHGSKEFQCKICDKVLISSSGLNSHIEVVHNTHERQHQCNVCGQQFRQKNTLNVHMNVHIENPEFKCEYCPKMFKSDHRRKLHMRTHTGEKPYKCRICGHAFANHTNWMRHEMIHSDDKPHKCSYCERSFILRRTLLEHEATHSGVKPIPRARKPQKSAVVDHEESVELIEEDYDEGSCSENSYQQQQPVELANRPVSINVARPIATQLATTSGASTIQSASMAVYNVVPSTSTNYGYILKF